MIISATGRWNTAVFSDCNVFMIYRDLDVLVQAMIYIIVVNSAIFTSKYNLVLYF